MSEVTLDRSPVGADPNYKYWAFISYSHQDEAWAKWLHHALETYHVPRGLVGRETFFGKVPRRLFPVFRDRDELPGAAELNEQIEAALRRSRNLVVICSPRSAVSKWVNEEIKTFKSLGRERHVFCLITDGEPNASDRPNIGLLECFPEVVRYRVSPDGELLPQRTEPIAADAREGRDGRDNAKLKLIAGILSVGYDDLKQREKRRQFWQRVRIGAASAFVLLMLAALYAGMADAGLPLIAGSGDRIRTFQDAHHLFLFRRPQPLPKVYHYAEIQRLRLFTWLAKARNPKTGWEMRRIGETQPETWSHSQALWAIFSDPDARPAALKSWVPYLATPFTETGAVMRKIEVPDSSGKLVKYGWLGHPYWVYPEGEPAMWTAAALGAALSRPGLITGALRQRYLGYLQYNQEVLENFMPPAEQVDGKPAQSWSSFLRNENKADYTGDTYATVLALQALIEARKAGAPWNGSIEERDRLLASTARWLIHAYVAHPGAGNAPDSSDNAAARDNQLWRPGWSSSEVSSEDPNARTFDGLTLQAYAALLEVQELTQHDGENRVVLPDEILQQIPKHLADCNNRALSFPNDSEEIASSSPFRSPRFAPPNNLVVGLEQVSFLWYPWAISASARWLNWATQHSERVKPEDLTRVRRTLGHLVVDDVMGPAAVRGEEQADWIYLAVEHLGGLSAVLPPQSDR